MAIHDSTFSTREALWARLEAREAPLLGIFANMLTRGAVLDIIARARAAGLRVVVGGPDPPNYPEAYLAAGANIVVFGEGEETLAELLPILGRSAALDAPELDLAALAMVAGIAFLDGDAKLQKSPARPALRDLDALGWPDREAIDLRAYLDCWRQHHGYSSLNIITARGCPYRCRWCSHSVFGFGHARRSPENVADEVATLQRRYAPDQLWYADDVFSISKPWLRAYAEAMEARGLRIPFECITRADRVDAEVVALLRRCLPDRCLTTVAYPMCGTPYLDAVADRVVAGRPWAEASERDHRIRGRNSKAYHAAASAWLQAELEDGRRAAEGQGEWAAARIPARLRSRRARLVLRLRAGEREA